MLVSQGNGAIFAMAWIGPNAAVSGFECRWLTSINTEWISHFPR
jgi:hypothetical protein